MKRQGIPAAIIRFICHPFTFFVGINGFLIYRGAKELGDIYDVVPRGHDFMQGMRIVGIAVISQFAKDEKSSEWRD